MSSDVCKHCTEAPASTSARPARCSAPSSAPSSCRRTFATAAATACRPAPSACCDGQDAAAAKEDGRVWKCTLCYDRLKGGQEPACAKACPTDSIQFGPLDELRERAERRGCEQLQAAGSNGARSTAPTRATGWAASAPSSSSSTSPRCTGCRPTRSCPPAISARLWRRPGAAARRWSPRPRRRCRGRGDAERARAPMVRAPIRAPTTAGRSSRSPSGSPESRGTSSPAGWPARRPSLARVRRLHGQRRARAARRCCWRRRRLAHPSS